MLRPMLVVLAGLLACAPAGNASICSNDSTGLVALTDLGVGLYQGFAGGLYAGGSNHRPLTHNAAGTAIANAMVPLDTLGQPDAVSGRFVLVSIGMSNATQEFATFVPKAMQSPVRHPRLLAVDCAEGGQATQDIRHEGAAYWDTVAARLRGHDSAPLQAQAVWLKEARRAPSEPFPASAESLTHDLGTILRIIKQKLPNVKLVYLTSRIYAGYASTALNPEPYAYESGFAVKWLIDAQVNGVDSLNFDPNQGPVEAPWLSWGPYLWADGLEGRSDGMIWRCDHFMSDGTHPSPSGRNVVADSLLAFFTSDETTMPWFTNPNPLAVTGAARGEVHLALAPNPCAERVVASFGARAGAPWQLEVFDLAGRRVREWSSGPGSGETGTRAWDLRVSAGARVQPGLYWVRLASGSRRAFARLVVTAVP